MSRNDKLNSDMKRFANLNFESFKELAKDESLSKYQKIGFPDTYREGQEPLILKDFISKVPALSLKKECLVLDIGCGCSELPKLLHDYCQSRNHELILVDSQEVLDQVADCPGAKKIAGKFPHIPEFSSRFYGKVDAILVYSVSHYLFCDGELSYFLDEAAKLLAPGGYLLMGDIPNVSKRNRFFSSEQGKKFHKEFMKTESDPVVEHYEIHSDKIDDGILLGLLQRYRNFGFESYLLPMNQNLKLGNRREDLLIVRN